MGLRHRPSDSQHAGERALDNLIIFILIISTSSASFFLPWSHLPVLSIMLSTMPDTTPLLTPSTTLPLSTTANRCSVRHSSEGPQDVRHLHRKLYCHPGA